MYRSLMALIERVGGAPSETPDARGAVGLTAIPEPLLTAVDSGECFLFGGEELTRNSGMPVWSRFLVGLIDYLADHRAVTREDAEKLHETWKSGRYDRVARCIREGVEGSEALAIRYASALYSKPAPLTNTLEGLAKVPFCAAVTPNLDGLVERIMDCEAFAPSQGLTVEDRITESLPFVLKLRGIANHGSMQIWRDTAIEDMDPNCREALRELFRTRTMLAVGASPDDLHRWLDAAGITRADHKHFAIAPAGDRELKRKAETLYRKFHIRTLVAGEDEDLLPFLQKLATHHKLSN
jgi:hypothetical protein